MNMYLVAAFWLALALVASFVSVWLGVSVAMVEIFIGVIGGNFLGLQTTPWVDFLAGFGSILLTFLAGADIDPEILRSKFKESILIGAASFLLPALGCFAYAYFVAGWTFPASQIAGIALSTTSVAIVYAVMVETGLNQTELGKIILASCFICDLGTVLALGLCFAHYDYWMVIFIAATIALVFAMNKLIRPLFNAFGNRVSQIEIKLVYFVLFLLGGLCTVAAGEAVLPAYILGLGMAVFLMKEKAVQQRMRVMAFAIFTPFFFLKAGLLISLKALWAGVLLIIIYLLVKVVAKFLGVLPLTRIFNFGHKNSMYATLLMSTGLTFGSISAMFGLTNHIISQAQYSILVTGVVLSGVIPTLIAQTFFRPAHEDAVVSYNQNQQEGMENPNV